MMKTEFFSKKEGKGQFSATCRHLFVICKLDEFRYQIELLKYLYDKSLDGQIFC